MGSALNKKVAVIGVPGAWSSEALATSFEERTGDRLLVDMAAVALDLEKKTVDFNGTDLTKLDAIVVKKIGRFYGPGMLDRLDILRYAHDRGVPVFSPIDAIYRLIDRLSCTVALSAHDIPMPLTFVTEDRDQAVQAIQRLGKCVLKPLFSTKARGMKVLDPASSNAGQLESDLQEFQADGNSVIYLQKLEEVPGRDLGLAFLGGKYLGCYARIRGAGSWNTTINSGGHYAKHEPSDEVIALAERAQSVFSLDFTTVDILEAESGPMVLEVSAFGGFRGLHEGLGLDAAGLYADHVLERLAQSNPRTSSLASS